MASSSVPLSLLAKGIGQLSKNGHERLDVYLEPEDYYNLQSQYQKLQLRELRRKAAGAVNGDQFENAHTSLPLHKTFLTRKGALLLFSEELAKKALEEERAKREKLAKAEKRIKAIEEPDSESPEPLRTCNDLSYAILQYGKKADYRRKGDDLYLRFLHESDGTTRGRSIRPGFSPKRYISTWSRYWDDGMLQKLRSGGMISDKTLYRQNPILPHLYKYASYNLSSIPPPYRVTRNMLIAPGNVPSYEFYRVKGPQQPVSLASREAASKAPPPSQLDDPMVEQDPLGAIQAVRYHESGEIQEMTYADLKPQEKQEILAELLIAAHEHQQHIRDTLELVISTNRNRAAGSDLGPASSASSELMADMQRAILSLVESPVRQQMRERQRLLQEQEEKEAEERRKEQMKEERRQKRKEERKAKKAAQLKATEEAKARKVEEANRIAEARQREKKPPTPEAKTTERPEDEAISEEKRLKEERRRKRREEREARRRAREEKLAVEAKEKETKMEEAARAASQRPSSRDQKRTDRDEVEPQKHDDIRKDESKKKREKKSRLKLEKEAEMTAQVEKSPEVLVDAQQIPTSDQPRVYILKEERSHAEGDNRAQKVKPGRKIITVLSQEGVIEIQPSRPREMPPQIRRRDAGLPILVPANTPAVEVRSVTGSDVAIDYEEVVVMEKSTRRKRSDASFVEEHRTVVRQVSRDQSHSAPRSIASSQSSGPKQILFAPELIDDDTSSLKQSGSFYGGRMPITSNLVKQTLSDKVLILSASQESAAPKSHAEQSIVGKQSYRSGEVSEQIVPSIGIEPATPLNVIELQAHSPTQTTVFSSHKSAPGTQYLSPTSSYTGGLHRSLGGSKKGEGQRSEKSESSSDTSQELPKKLPSKDGSDDDDSDRSDSSSQSSHKPSQKSLKRETASKSSQTSSQSSKKKSKHGLKGHKGPGSQSSSSLLKSTSTTKKSLSIRGSLPPPMKKEGSVKAAVRMPDGEYISVGGSLTLSGGADQSGTNTSEDAKSAFMQKSEETTAPSLPKPSLKSVTDKESFMKTSRRVSFHDADEVVGMTRETDEEEAQDASLSDYDITEESEDQDEWPAVQQGEAHSRDNASSQSRPVSSRSEKLTAHAQKVAAMVIHKHRPDSGLDEDAKKAAQLWNRALEDSDITSEEEEEKEEWAGTKQAVISAVSSSKSSEGKQFSSKHSSVDVAEKKRKERLEKIKAEKSKEKELCPSVSITAASPKKEPVVSGSLSSIASSVSSVQEAFVNEIQRKASDLGIEPGELEFQADVVNKLEQSAITPEEVEVVRDKGAGRHIVRSRRSSTTVSSVLSPSTVEKEPSRDGVVEKQKLVVDLNLEKGVSASLSRTSSVTSSMTSQSEATSRRSSVSQRRSSIPVDKENVKLDYDVTSYESKLGDPKLEEPTIQTGRPRVEPEKIKVAETQATAPPAVSRVAEESKVPTAGSVKSQQSGVSKATGKTDKSRKQPPVVKGSLRKGQNEETKAEKAKPASTAADSSSVTKEVKSQKPIKKSEKPSKKLETKKGAKKLVDVAAENEVVRRESPEKLPTKTPETPFRAGRAKEAKQQEYIPSGASPEEQESVASGTRSKKSEKPTKKSKKKVEPITQIEKDSPKPTPVELPKEESPKKSTPTPSGKGELEVEDEYPEYVTPVSVEDNYEFVRKEDTPEPTPEPALSPSRTPAKTPVKAEDAKSQVSEATAVTEATATETSSQAAAQAAEDEAELAAKMAAKQEREKKRAAAAEKRRMEVERKRKEKEEQIRREKEEQDKQEKMKEELEAERRKREEAARMKKEEAEREKQREKEEEELRQKRLLQQQERERRQQEEYKRKMEEIQRKKREEEERRREEARRRAEEEEARRKEEEELMAQMEESERELYAQRKKEEEEERKRKEEEMKRRMEEEAKIAMEQARMEAKIRAKQAAALEEKLRFVREFFTEANGLDQTQHVNRSFTFSYFELMRMLGLDVAIE